MKILHVTSKMNPESGGVSQAIQTIIEGISPLGIVNEIVCVEDPASLTLDKKFKIFAMGPAKTSWGYSSRLFEWLKENLMKYDTVIIHGLWQYHTYATFKAIKATKLSTKVFIMPHGMLDPYFQQAPGRKLKAIRNWIYWKIFEHKTISRSHGLLFTCTEERRLARLPFSPYKPKQEIVVGMGTNQPPQFADTMGVEFESRCPPIKGHRYILSLGRIDEKKGIDMLITAYAGLIDENVKSGGESSSAQKLPKLVIAGPGIATAYGRKIARMVSRNVVLKSQIFFTGMLIGHQKWGAIYGCETFILPSHQENFGIAIIEALACGKPVLISNKVNIWQEIQKSTGGYVENDDVRGTMKLLQEWQDTDLQTRQTMSANAKRNFEQTFSIPAFSLQFINKLKEALN